jgi:hypothetical protein
MSNNGAGMTPAQQEAYLHEVIELQRLVYLYLFRRFKWAGSRSGKCEACGGYGIIKSRSTIEIL